MSEDKELNRGTSQEVNSEQGTRKTMNVFNSGLHHKVAISSKKRYDISSM